MAFFIIILTLLFIYFIFDYNFCSKGLVFYLGNNSLIFLKKCSNVEKVYRSTIYLMYPFLQHLFVHLYYFYLEKKKSYLNYLISEKLGNSINQSDSSNSNRDDTNNSLIRIIEKIKKFLYIKLLNVFFFIVEYTNLYENINFNSYINTREVLNNNNFGAIIIDYYLPNTTVKKRNANDGDKLNSPNEIDLYDLVNINHQKKRNLILIDKKWKRILNIEKVDDANVQYLYLQDTVLIQYLQFSRILKNNLLKKLSDENENKRVQQDANKKEKFNEEEGSNNSKSGTITNKETKEEIKKSSIKKRIKEDEKLGNGMIPITELEKEIKMESNVVEKEFEENVIINEKKVNEKLNAKEKIQNSNDVNKTKENIIKDKLNICINQLKYKNIKGIIVIVPEIFYNYINMKEMENKIPLYYFLTKDVKIDSFTIIAKLLGYICVHIHINVNFGFSIPFIFKIKNTNILNISDNFSFHENKNSFSSYNRDNDMNIKEDEDSFDMNSSKSSLFFNNEINEYEQVGSSPSYINYHEKGKINSNNKCCNNNNINNYENICKNSCKEDDMKEKYNNELFCSGETNIPLFSSPFSFFSDNYNDLNIAMNHFKTIFKNYNFVFLSFNDGTNILLNYFLEKIYKKKKKKGMDEELNNQFNLNSANVYKCRLHKYKDNMGIKTDPYNNTNEKKNSSKTYQLNKSDEEKESINMQNKNNIINIFFKDKKKGKESKEKEKNNKIKKRSVEKISDDVKKKEKKILYDMYDEEKKKDKVNEKNSEDSNRSYDEVDIFNEVVNEQIKHKAEVEVEEEEEEEEEKVEKNFVASENCYEEDENISRKSKEDEECTEEEERIVVNEKVKREQEKEKNKEKHKKEKRKNNKGKNKEKLKKEKTKKNKEKWKREKMESFLSLSKFSNIFNKSTENILEKNNGECKGKNEKNESKFPNLNNTKITKKKLDSNTDKDYSNNKNTNINLTNFTSYIKKNNSIHQTFLTKNVKEKMEENKMKSNDNFVENLKFKKLKLNVLKPFRNKDFKIKDDPLKDTSGFSQKFRYSFFKIKNKFKQNFNTSENKIIQDKKTMENDKIMLNSFNKNKNGKVSEENSSTLMDSNYNDYRKKYTKELCILINFSYNNMFDIFNYPDDYMEKKKKKFSLIHKIFYSLNIFFNSFSTLIKQRYFFSCTNELTKFLKISLFFNYDCEFIYKTNNQNNTEYNLFRTFNKSCSICGSKLKYFNDCYCISYKETDPLINRIYNEKNGFINNSNNSNIENGIYNAYNSGYKDSENYNKNTFNYNSLNHSNNNSRCYHKIYNKSSDPFNWISTKCNNSNNIENDYSSICCNCDKNMNRKFCNTNKNDENNSNHAFYKNNSILYDNYCLTDISDKLNSIRNRKKNNKTYNLSKKINSIVKNSENYFNFINENNLYINDYLIKNKKKEKRKIYYDKNNEKNLNILCSNSTNEDNFNNSNLLLTDESNINDINIRYITNIIYGTNFQNKLKVHLNIEKLHEKWKIYFKENKSHLNIQDYFLFNLSFIYNLYNYLILIYICTYFSEESYFNFCNNQKFYQFIKKVHSYNKKKEHNWNTRHICDASIIPNFLDFTDYKLLKVFFFLLQNSSNKFISKNIEYFNFPIVFIFCSDAKNFNFNHFDIIKISKNNNIIYLLYKRGNEGLFLSGLKPFIWIHKVLFDFVESMFLSSYDK